MKVDTGSTIKKNYHRRTYSKSAKAKGVSFQSTLRTHGKKLVSGMKFQRSHSVSGEVHSKAKIRSLSHEKISKMSTNKTKSNKKKVSAPI